MCSVRVSMPSAVTVGLLYVLPLVIWAFFLVVILRVLTAGALEDSLGYLVILKRRRTEFVSLLVLLAASQIIKDLVQVGWGLGAVDQYSAVLIALILNIVGAGAVFSIAWVLLRPASITPAEDRLLTSMAESLYALGRPEEFGRRPPEPPK